MSDWWSRKLSDPTAPQATQRSGLPPTHNPSIPVRYVPEGNVTATPVSYDQDADQLMTKSQAAKQADPCPNCYSGNYFAPMGSQRKRCYDCGYPILQQGSGAGMPGGSAGGPSTPAKQASQGGGFNPNIIVDRIG